MTADASTAHFRPGTARGEDTARRILAAAIEVFAEEGYDGASTRALAERAKVNLPAIQYYFGSKEGLYRAAVADTVALIETHLAPSAARVEAVLRGKPDSGALMAALDDLLDAFTVLVTSHDTNASRGALIARAEIEGQPALEQVHETVTRLGVRPCRELIARILGRPAEEEEILVRTLAILGQVFVFHGRCSNESARQSMSWEQLDPRKIRVIQKIVREQTGAILEAVRSKK